MWIKICGLTSAEAVAAALEAQVDAIGFVFAPSKRQVTLEKAAQLAEPARGRVKCVAVTLHPSQQLVNEIVRTFRPDYLQTDIQDDVSGATMLPVLRSGQSTPSTLPVRFLFEGPESGRGAVADWSEARALARRGQLILAGGLNETNVAAAIEAVRPFGVDVSSGVEAEPGVKSPEKILRFVQAARTAFRGLEEKLS